MYIKTVEIDNYRAFKSFQISLSTLSIIIGENEAGKTNLFDALSLPLNSNDISFNKKRLAVSDINRDSITDFYKAIIEKKTDDEIKSLIPKVRVEVEFTDPSNCFQKKIVSNWIYGDPTESLYRIKYESAPKDADDFIQIAKKMLADINDVKDTHWFTLPVDLYDYSITTPHNGKKVSYTDLQHIAINSIDADRDSFSDSNTQRSNDILTKMLVTSLNADEKANINNAYTGLYH